MFRTITKCRGCNGTDLTEVLSLGVQALANDFVPPGWAQEGRVPLRVLYCNSCTLAQLGEVVEPARLYTHYNYRSSTSAMMKQHFKSLFDDLIKENGRKSLLEIASNDGTMLEYALTRSFSSVYGIEPARNLAKISIEKGFGTRNNYFSAQVAKSMEKADTIVARHVFAHVDDVKDFLVALEYITHKNSLVAIEVPYAQDILDVCSFDQVYHEHLSYLSVQALVAMIHGSAFSLYKVVKYPIHGGALVFMLRHSDWHGEMHQSVSDFLAREDVSLERWQEFAGVAKQKIDRLRVMVHTLVASGNYVCGYGASAKSSVWCQACGFTKRDISFILDNTPEKIGKLSPGSDIPIVSENVKLEEVADYGVCFAWNFLPEILSKQASACEKGFRFIMPVPEVKIINHEAVPVS